MRKIHPRLLMIAALALAPLAKAAENPTPLMTAAEIGHLHREVTTSSPEAQHWFNQGLALTYAFDHDNAIRSFQRATELDPSFAMAWWGIANACGPHINFPMVPPARAKLAWEALQHAAKHAGSVTPVEKALIDAQMKRFADPHPDDRRPLDEAYADAMRAVWKAYPDDADIGALFAESMMNLRPWDLWQADGTPQPGTAEIVATLAAVRKFAPSHPQACHLSIHALESSPNPASAVPAADALRNQQPGIGHMVHMPTHIDVLVGRWEECIESNARAVEADIRTRAAFGNPDGFLWLYMGHNRHMLAFGAMMTGRSELALRHIRALAAELPTDEAWLADWGFVADYFNTMPLEVMVRFGKWDEILATPDLPEHLPIARAMRRVARGIAHAAMGDIPAARGEQKEFFAARARVSSDAFFANNTATDILGVAEAMLEGEILYREGRRDEGLDALREAVRREDRLRYDEPPDWIIPVRHALGAALMQSGHFGEAENVYRADLKKWPGNGWSLFGLAQALKRLGRADEAAVAEEQFKKSWAHGDVLLASSCFCQPGVGE